MKNEVYERAAWAVTTLVVFAVGMFAGARACAPDPVVSEKIVVREKVVEICRDDCAGTPAPEPAKADEPQGVNRAIETPSDDRLPDAESTLNPARRKRLLAWVKEQSKADLEECRSALVEVARVTVTVRFSEERPPRASVNAAEGDLPLAVERCVERRVAAWAYPEKLVEGQSEILFGLRL